MRLLIFLATWLLGLNHGLSQTTHSAGALVGTNLGLNLQKGWRANINIETRHLFKSYREEVWEYDYVRTDMTFSLSNSLGAPGNFSAGYMLINEPGEDRHRLIQQYTLVDEWWNLRWAHRIMTDQTFGMGFAPRFRLRYRLATEIPLNGQEVDAGELYLRLNNEYVNEIRDGKYDIEIRLVPLMGYAILPNARLEWGMDYRTDSFIRNRMRNNYRFTLNYFLNL